jgi:hypothetical protein
MELTFLTAETEHFVPAAARKMMLSGSNTSSSSKGLSAMDLISTETSFESEQLGGLCPEKNVGKFFVQTPGEEHSKMKDESMAIIYIFVSEPVRRLPMKSAPPPKLYYATWWRCIARRLSHIATTQQTHK